MPNVKLNRLGKAIAESGCGSLKKFITNKNLKVKYGTLYNWIATKATVNEYKSSLYIDEIADALDTTRIDVLNMIATEPIYDVKFVKKHNEPTKVKTELQLMREREGLSAKDVATLVGDCDAQFIYDIENGKIRNFHTSTQLKNYMELFGIGMGEMVRMQDEACKRYTEVNGEYKKKLREERGLTVIRERVPINKLQEIRMNRGLSTAEVAELVGFEKGQHITDIEHGRRRYFPTPGIKSRYLKFTGLTEQELDAIMEELYENRKTGRKNKPMDKIKLNTPSDDMEVYATYEETEDKCIENPHVEPLLSAEDTQKVMTILYGKVDFATFKIIENILGGRA